MPQKMLGLKCKCSRRACFEGRNTDEILKKIDASGWQDYPMAADGTNGYCPDPNCQSDKVSLGE